MINSGPNLLRAPFYNFCLGMLISCRLFCLGMLVCCSPADFSLLKWCFKTTNTENMPAAPALGRLRQEDLSSRPLSAMWQVSGQPRLYETCIKASQMNANNWHRLWIFLWVRIQKSTSFIFFKKRIHLFKKKRSTISLSHDSGTLSCFLWQFIPDCVMWNPFFIVVFLFLHVNT